MGNKMGGLTSKNVKLRKNDKDDSDGKRVTVSSYQCLEVIKLFHPQLNRWNMILILLINVNIYHKIINTTPECFK